MTGVPAVALSVLFARTVGPAQAAIVLVAGMLLGIVGPDAILHGGLRSGCPPSFTPCY